MKTVCVQIGNTDDKLPQAGWSNFVTIADSCVRIFGKVHFFGGSDWYKPWQNACWVFEIEEEKIPPLKADLKRIREIFMQTSIAWLEGETLFL